MIKKIDDYQISHTTWEGANDDPNSDDYGMIFETNKDIKLLTDKINEIIEVVNKIPMLEKVE